MATGVTFTLEAINRELVDAEKALEENENRILSSLSQNVEVNDEPVVTRLKRLECEVADLILAQDIASKQDLLINENDDLKRIEILGEILCRHKTKSPLYQKLFNEEFIPLLEYLNSHLVLSLRRQLYKSHYPTDCEELLQQFEKNEIDSDYFVLSEYCESITKLTTIHKKVSLHVDGTAPVFVNQIVQELCRPYVQRVKYHFVDPAENRPTNSRIDRLPEWLLNYLKENIFQSGGAWEFVYYGLAAANDILALDFINEIIRMVQWVLGERNFFRDQKVSGPTSKPHLLCNAVEQLLQFDQFVRDLLPEGDKKRIISLVDVCITGDEELLAWWLARERESVFSTLFEETAPNLNRISPRAELFCALIRSIQKKAAVFSFSGPYLSQVAAPLCVQFLDAIHESAGDLRKVLTQRKMLTDHELEENINSWIKLINGARVAATMLINAASSIEKGQQSSGVDEDLVRFGKSLERLHRVLLDDLVTDIVEVLLMERARFAGYLMRCSHMLSSSGAEVMDVLELTDISPDLEETQRILHLVLHICADGSDLNNDEESCNKDPSKYAPLILNDRILSLVAEKLLEVALDIQGMTPDLLRPGCAVFARDVDALFGPFCLPSHALRVLDIVKFMRLEGPQLGGIGGALCGLSGQPAPLTEAVFEGDDRLFDEAISMIRAKGFIYLELADVFAVLNRRRDLT